jgi:hypothetical protein
MRCNTYDNHRSICDIDRSKLTLKLKLIRFVLSIVIGLNISCSAPQSSSDKFQETEVTQGAKNLGKAPTQTLLKVPSKTLLKITNTSTLNKGKQSPIQILILSDLIGYIEPCGCTIDLTLGGIQRTIALIKEAQAQGPTAVLVAGSHLFEYPEIAPDKKAQQVAKAKLIRQILYETPVHAFTPGINDLAAGYKFYQKMQKDFPLPDVTTNQVGGSAKIIQLGQVKLGVFAIAPVKSQLGIISENDQATPILQATQRSIDSLKSQGADVIIAMATMERQALKVLAKQVKDIDFWVLGTKALEEKSLHKIDSSRARLIEAGDRGRHLARLTLYNAKIKGTFQDPLGQHQKEMRRLKRTILMKEKFSRGLGGMRTREQIAQLKTQLAQKEQQVVRVPYDQKVLHYKLQAIEDTLVKDPHVDTSITQYQEKLKTINLSVAGKVVPLPKNGNGYAGIKECEMCHPMAVKFWKETKHAVAWKTLEDANKTFDVECVSCHVAGWQKPGGSALGHTDLLKNVQCEACHGPSAKHAMVGGGEAWTKRSVPEKVCKTCHNKHHSPAFDYDTYLPKVIGPGHGEPYVELPTSTPKNLVP